MWIYLIIQGVVGCAVLIGFAVWQWPTHLLAALLSLPFPALFIWGGLFMRRREQELKPKRDTYLAGNEGARRDQNRARLAMWLAVPIIFAILFLASVIWPDGADSPAPTWAITGVVIAVAAGAALYSTLVRTKIEDAATREAAGELPPTPEEQRKKTIWLIAALVLLGGIVAFDQFVEAPVSAVTVFFYGALIFAAGAFIWRKLNPPRDR